MFETFKGNPLNQIPNYATALLCPLFKAKIQYFFNTKKHFNFNLYICFMRIHYSKDVHIVVIEFSSTSMKYLKLQPRKVNSTSNRHQINKYANYDDDKPMFLGIKSLISEDLFVDINEFKSIYIGQIQTIFKKLSLLRPQMFRIIATGHYRTIININELFDLIKSVFTKEMKKLFTNIELLTPAEESYFSFLSWKKTYKFKEEESNFVENSFKLKKQGLNIDVGGGTTEITFFENDDFKNTTSISIGSDSLINSILKQELISHDTIWKELLLSKKEVQKKILNINVPKKVDYTICTGSTLIINEDGEKNESFQFSNYALGVSITNIISRVEKKYIENLNNKDFKILTKICGLYILKVLLDFFKVKNYYLNLASLRIGVYYQTKELLVKFDGRII